MKENKIFSCVRKSADIILYHVKANEGFVSDDQGNNYGFSEIQVRYHVIRITVTQDLYHSDCLKKVIHQKI